MPVVQMAAIARHPQDGLQRLVQTGGGLGGPDPAHVMRHRHGKKVQPDIGGRGAVGHLRARGFLEIVGRQEIVLLGHEGLEEPPGLARDLPQAGDLGGAQARLAAHGPGPAC